MTRNELINRATWHVCLHCGEVVCECSKFQCEKLAKYVDEHGDEMRRKQDEYLSEIRQMIERKVNNVL